MQFAIEIELCFGRFKKQESADGFYGAVAHGEFHFELFHDEVEQHIDIGWVGRQGVFIRPLDGPLSIFIFLHEYEFLRTGKGEEYAVDGFGVFDGEVAQTGSSSGIDVFAQQQVPEGDGCQGSDKVKNSLHPQRDAKLARGSVLESGN